MNMKLIQLIVLLFTVVVIIAADTEQETKKEQKQERSIDNEEKSILSATTTQSPCALVAKLLTSHAPIPGAMDYTATNANYATRLATLYSLLGALSNANFAVNPAAPGSYQEVQSYVAPGSNLNVPAYATSTASAGATSSASSSSSAPATFQALQYNVVPGSNLNVPTYSSPAGSSSASSASSSTSESGSVTSNTQTTYSAPGSAAIKTLVFSGSDKPTSSVTYSSTPISSNLVRVAASSGYGPSVPDTAISTNYPSSSVAVSGYSSQTKAAPSDYSSVPAQVHGPAFAYTGAAGASSGVNAGYSSGGMRYSQSTFGHNNPIPSAQFPSSASSYYSAASRYGSTPVAPAQGSYTAPSGYVSGVSAYSGPAYAPSSASLVRPIPGYAAPLSPVATGYSTGSAHLTQNLGPSSYPRDSANFQTQTEQKLSIDGSLLDGSNVRSYASYAPASGLSATAAEDVIPVPLCPKNYLFSCQSQIQPVPCEQQALATTY